MSKQEIKGIHQRLTNLERQLHDLRSTTDIREPQETSNAPMAKQSKPRSEFSSSESDPTGKPIRSTPRNNLREIHQATAES